MTHGFRGLSVATPGPDPDPDPDPEPQTGSPFLAFSDLESGPKSGNTDTSYGVVSGVDGCYVSIWGNRLGATQDTSTITIGGAQARVIYWGPAVPPWSPSNLVNGYHDMQIIIAQVRTEAAMGLGAIQVTVGGKLSNTLPFTVRTGRILYFTSTGTSAGTGTWQSPLQFTNSLFNSKVNQSGDIVYVKDIIKTSDTRMGSGGTNGLNGNTMTQTRPGAIVGYPGSVNQFGVYGTSGNESAFILFDGSVVPFSQYPEAYLPWWIWSKVDMRGYVFPLNKRCGRSRVVGCTYSNPTTSQTDWSVFAIQGQYEQLLGCEFFEIGSPGPTNFGSWTHTWYASPGDHRSVNADDPASSDFGKYPPYVDGQGTYEAGWNYVHDCMTFDAWHMYNFNISISGSPMNFYKNTIDEYATYSSYLGGGYYHHNVLVDHAGNGASFTTMVAGDHYVYSNIFVRPGAMVSNVDWGYTAPDGTTGITTGQSWDSSNAFRINAGPQDIDLAGCGGPLTVHIWHNTVYDAGTAHGQTRQSGKTALNYGVFEYGEGGWNHNIDLDVRNNIFHQPSGKQYVNQSSLTSLPLSQDPSIRNANLWYGAGVPPTWDSNTVNADPLFVTSGVQYPNLNLQDTSPALGKAGAILDAPFAFTDFHGNPITLTGGADMGAIQKFKAPTSTTLPQWVQDLDVLELYQIPNTSIGNTDDYLATIRHPAFGNEENLITAESGFAVRTEGSTLIFGVAGGHSDGCFNQMVKLELETETPRFVEVHPGSPNADLPANSPVTPSAYYGPIGNQIPTGCHNYDRLYFINSQDRFVRIQTTSPYSAGGAPSLFQDCASFDWETKTWAPPKTIPDVPSSSFQLLQDTTCQDPLTEEIYHWRATTLRKYDPVANDWTTWSTAAPQSEQAQHPIACNGTEFCMLEMDADGTIYRMNMADSVITTTTAVGDGAYGVKFPGLTAGQTVRSRLMWCPPLDKYLFMRPNGGGANLPAGFTNIIFTLSWSGDVCTVEELPLTGVALPVQNCLGPAGRLQYIPNLEGCVYALNGDTDLFFFRVA